MKRAFALTLVALFLVAGCGHFKRWSNPGHNKGAAAALP